MAGAYCVCLRQKHYLYRRHSSNLSNHPDRFLRAWLRICTQTLKSQALDHQFERLARRFTRSWSLRLLAFGSCRDGRCRLREAMETWKGDYALRLLYGSTYLGSVPLLKFAKAVRRSARNLLGRKWRIDLSASPQAIFDALPKEAAVVTQHGNTQGWI
jgi:hypothetical protein